MKKRPGRFRRWLLRPLLWSLAALAVSVFLAQRVLDSPRVRGWLAHAIEGRLEARLERGVTIRDLAIHLLRCELELRGVEIAGPDDDSPVFLRVPRVVIVADPGALGSGRMRLEQVRLERPEAELIYALAGGDNLPHPARRPPRQHRFELYIAQLVVLDGHLALDQDRVRFSLAARHVAASLEGRGELDLQGQVSGQELVLRLPGAHSQALVFRGTLAIRRDGLHIQHMLATGRDFEVDAKGRCTWSTRRPRPAGSALAKRCVIDARGHTNGRQLAALGYFRDLDGRIDFDGTFEWRPGSFGWRSRVAAPRLVLWNRRLDAMRGVLVADRQGIRLEVEHAGYAGGSLSGSVDYDRRQADEPVRVDLAYRGLALDTVLADQQIPLDGFATRLEGRMRYRFARRDPRHGDGGGELELRPFEAVASPQEALALAGHAVVRIKAGVVELPSIAANSPRQSVLAHGRYALATRRGRFDYELTTADLAALVARLPFVDRDGPAASAGVWPSACRGVLRGALDLAPGTLGSDLQLDLAEVEARVLQRPQPVRGTLHASASGVEDLRIEVGGSEAAMLVRGVIPFRETEAQPLTLVIDAVDWPLDAARVWVPFDLPLDGPITGRIEVTAAPGMSQGRVDAEARPAVLAVSPTGGAAYPLPVDSVRARLSWDGTRVEIQQLRLKAPAGVLTGGGTLARGATGALSMVFEGAALELARPPLGTFTGGLDGRADARLAIAGSLMEPSFELALRVPELKVGAGRPLGVPSRLDAHWNAEELRIDAEIAQRVTLTGGGKMAGDALRFDLEGHDLAALAELLLPAAVGVDGGFTGHLRVLRTPIAQRVQDATARPGLAAMEAWLELDHLRASVAGRRFENRDAVRLRADAGGIDVLAADLAEVEPAPGTSPSRLVLAGHSGWGRDAALDLATSGSFDIAWLPPPLPGVAASGRIDFAGGITGPLAAPELKLAGTLVDAQALLPGDVPYRMDHVRGSVRLETMPVVASIAKARLWVEEVAAEFAGGTLRASGWVDLPSAVVTRGLGQPTAGADASAAAPSGPRLALQVAARNLHLRWSDAWRLAGGADVRIASREDDDGVVVRGRARLTEARFEQNLPVGFAEVITGALARQRVQVVPAGDRLDAIHLDLAVELPSGLEVHNNLADLRGGADLVVQGTLARPRLLGTVDFEPGGRLVWNSTQYEVDRGRLTFADPLRTDPEVDLLARTRVREYDVNLSLSGTMDRLDAGFSSDPPLPDLEVFRLLATGDSTGVGGVAPIGARDETEAGSTSAAALLYGQAASVVGERVGALFGFDSFRVAPLTGSGDALSRTRVSVGKRLSRDVFVTYSADPSSTEDPRLQVEWQISRRLVLVLSQNGDETYAADARWEQSF